MRPYGRIEFLFRRRFPRYTDAVDKVVNRIVRETDDPDLFVDETLERIAGELGVDFDELRLPDEPEIEQPEPEGRERDASGRLTPWGRERLRRYLVAARDYKDALFDMDDEEFWELYSQEQTKERDEQQVKGTEKDRYDFFNLPHATADFAYWRVVPRWLPEEAVALTFGKEPRVVNSETLRPHHPPSPFREEYSRRLELVRRAVGAGLFEEEIDPAVFVRWAREVRLSLPVELQAWANQHPSSEPEPEVSKATLEEIEQLREALAERDKRIEDLCKGFDELEPLSQRSLMRLVLGMAIARFEYHTSGNSGTAKLLTGLLEELDLKLGDDTIREWLKFAASYLNYEWHKPIRMPTGVPRRIKPSESTKPNSD